MIPGRMRWLGSMSNGRIVQQVRTSKDSGVSTVFSDTTVSGMTRAIGASRCVSSGFCFGG